MKQFLPHLVLLLGVVHQSLGQCANPSQTTTTIHGVPSAPGSVCSGALIFEDNFNTLDAQKWQHETTLAGGGNWEFQWYTNNRSNSYTENGILHLRPTLTSDVLGEAGLTSALVNLHGGTPTEGCTNPAFYGCERQGTASNVINPIRSSRLRTYNSFSFKYGRVEINARIPTGDWLWPALWFMPRYNKYGTWPASGEIDLMESRGNPNLVQNGVNIGTQQVGTTLHFGPYPALNAYDTAHATHNTPAGWNQAFHRYGMTWTPSEIIFTVDGVTRHTISAGTGFWNRGGFAANAPGVENPWRTGTTMAPFDEEFYLLINLAVGGVVYFPDGATNPGGKPWSNGSPTAASDFWNGRSQWLAGWNMGTTQSHFQIDYVRIWAL